MKSFLYPIFLGFATLVALQFLLCKVHLEFSKRVEENSLFFHITSVIYLMSLLDMAGFLIKGIVNLMLIKNVVFFLIIKLTVKRIRCLDLKQ